MPLISWILRSLGASVVLMRWLWVGSRMGTGHQKHQAMTRSLMWRSPTLHFSERGEGLEMELLIDRACVREPHSIPAVGFLRACRWVKTSIRRMTQPSSMETEVSAFRIPLDQALCISSSNHLHLYSCSVAQLCLTLWPLGLWPAKLLCLWNFLGKDAGVGCHFFPGDFHLIICIL